MSRRKDFYGNRPRCDKRGFDLISDALPFDRLWYAEPKPISNAIGYAKFYSRSHDAVIRVYDEEGNVIETHRILSVKFKFDKRSQLFIRTHNKALIPVAVSVSNEDSSPARINA